MVVAICDDEEYYIDMLIKNLSRCKKELDVHIKFKKYTSPQGLLFEWEDEKLRADILFLDIHMPKIDGLEVATRLRKDRYEGEIIFFTKSKPEVFRSFDVDAFHYIVKDETSDDRIKEIFVRAVTDISDKVREYTTFSCSGETVRLSLRDILYFHVNGRVTTVYYKQGMKKKEFKFYTSLGNLENMLINKGFVRVSRSNLVNMRRIERWTEGEVCMQDGSTLTISRTRKEDVMAEILHYYKEA